MIPDYRQYKLSHMENIKYIMQGIAGVILLGILFYQSLVAILILLPMIWLYRKRMKKELMKERLWNLNLEFRDGIIALSAALEAGYSAEHALEEACKDLRQIYKEDALILREFNFMINQLHMNITIERVMSDFGERTGMEDILSFSEVFSTAKRTGGDLIHVIKVTSNIISDKIEIKREILTLITAKRLEANIMKLTPLFILIYLNVTSSGFLDPLYHNFLGIITMSILLICYLAASFAIDKIIAIEV